MFSTKPDVSIGSATPGRARANAVAEIPLPWQSKVVIIKLYINDILTALADAANERSMPCHKQQTGAPLDVRLALPISLF